MFNIQAPTVETFEVLPGEGDPVVILCHDADVVFDHPVLQVGPALSAFLCGIVEDQGTSYKPQVIMITLKLKIQWGSENRTCQLLKWSEYAGLGMVLEWHLSLGFECLNILNGWFLDPHCTLNI